MDQDKPASIMLLPDDMQTAHHILNLRNTYSGLSPLGYGRTYFAKRIFKKDKTVIKAEQDTFIKKGYVSSYLKKLQPL